MVKCFASVLIVLALNACAPSVSDDATGEPSATDEAVFVYAHTPSSLYRIDPDTLAVTLIGDFFWGRIETEQMTDIAIDKTGQLIGISASKVFRIDPATAATTTLSSSLNGTFNGLSFVPADMLGLTGDDVLVGTRATDGKVFRIDPMTGAVTEIGNMGGFRSSGDLVAVTGFGTVQTVASTSTDMLAKLDATTFAAHPIGTGTGYRQIWGVAFWKDKVYGFTNEGHFVLIDPATGAASVVEHTPGLSWWGAAVTTRAPVLL